MKITVLVFVIRYSQFVIYPSHLQLRNLPLFVCCGEPVVHDYLAALALPGG
jgi:hypothetical protein